jgi:hypothetical protein
MNGSVTFNTSNNSHNALVPIVNGSISRGKTEKKDTKRRIYPIIKQKMMIIIIIIIIMVQMNIFMDVNNKAAEPPQKIFN